MIDLGTRSYTKEVLDNPLIPFADIQQNMKELNAVNTLLGGHKISIAGLKNIIRGRHEKKMLTICEIGCGGGDNLQAIERWCTKNLVDAAYIGIDIKPECIEYAKQQYPDLKSKWIISDYKLVTFEDEQPDIIFSSLFCHHFTDNELSKMLQWMKNYARLGFFINDLHRHFLAYYSIKILTTIFSKSYLVKNDAPLSVARGFKKIEWHKLLKEAGIRNYSTTWKWAFRHLVVCRHD